MNGSLVVDSMNNWINGEELVALPL